MCVPNESIPMYAQCWPQRQSVRFNLETDRVRRTGETAMGGRYATRRVLVSPAAEYSPTRVSLMALAESVHSDGAIPPQWQCFLLMCSVGHEDQGNQCILHSAHCLNVD
jgi:hypothetical protein